jgi:PAS domain S-box-containing protein
MPSKNDHCSFLRAVIKRSWLPVSLWWADLPLRWKGFTVVLIPVTALFCGFASVYVVQNAEDSAEDWVLHTTLVLDNLHNTQDAIFDAQHAARAFVNSGREDFLAPYWKAQNTLRQRLLALGGLVKDNAEQTKRVADLQQLATERLQLLANLVDASRRNNQAEVTAFENQLLLESKTLTTRLRAKFDEVDQEENRLRTERNEELQSVRRMSLIITAASAVCGLLGGLAAMRLFSRGIVHRIHFIGNNAERLAKALPLEPATRCRDEIGELGRRLEDASSVLSSNREALRESQGRLQALLDNALFAVYVKNLDGKFAVVNRAFASFLGMSKEEIIGKTGHDLYSPNEADIFEKNDRAALEAGKPLQVEEILRRKDGIHTFISNKFPLHDANGNIYALCGISTDITQRKQAEDELRQRKHQMEAAVHTNQLIMDNSRDVICTVNAAGNFLTVSAACETVWGYKRQELIGRGYIDLVCRPDVARTDQAMADIMAGKRARDFENRCVRKDGSLVNVMWSTYWSARDNIMFCVAHDVTERAKTAAALAAAKAEAERANHAKSEFLSRMSHELRTPLNAILGFAQILELDAKTKADHESVDQILRAGQHLLELINEVLDFSRIEAGRLSISTEPVELGDAIRDCAQLMRPLAEQRQVDLKINDDELSERYVLADRQRLKQVLLNFLSNAVKYNRENGSVAISCEPAKDKTLRLNVRDTGHGITPQNLKRLFSPFERLGADGTATQGTGLGLALSKRLVELMGGRIGVDSTPGEGSLFWIELPQTEAPVQRLERDNPDIQLDLGEDVYSEEKTLLYIEDNLPNLRLIERIFEKQPRIKLLAAMQGGLGIDLARQHCPDLILLDVHLPDIPGPEVLRRLRQEKRTGDIPVVVLTADSTPGQIARVLAAGATDYLIKPLEVKRFLRVIENVLDLKEPAPAP